MGHDLDRAAAARVAARGDRGALRATVTATRSPIGSGDRLRRPDLAPYALVLHGERSVPGTLERVVQLAPRAVPGCVHASVTSSGRRGPETPAASGEPARALDDLQYAAGTGPGLRVLRGESPVLDTVLPARAGRPEVTSVLSCRLGESALNLYGTLGAEAVPRTWSASAWHSRGQRPVDSGPAGPPGRVRSGPVGGRWGPLPSPE